MLINNGIVIYIYWILLLLQSKLGNNSYYYVLTGCAGNFTVYSLWVNKI